MTIRRLQHDYSSVGVVIDSDSDLEDISYCSTCMAVGELNRLKERIWLDDKGRRLPDPPGAEISKCVGLVGVLYQSEKLRSRELLREFKE